MIVTQRYEDEAGKPLAGLSLQGLSLECNRVQRRSLDPSLHLSYPDLRTDEAGCVYLPAYDTVFRLASASWPEGHKADYPRLGWFECPKKVGLMPVCTLSPKPTGLGFGGIGEVGGQFLKAMRDKDLETVKRLSLGAEWGWLDDEKAADLSFAILPGLSVTSLSEGMAQWHEKQYSGRAEEMTKVRGWHAGSGFGAVQLADYKPDRHMVLVFKEVPDGWRFVTWEASTGRGYPDVLRYANRLKKSLAAHRPHLRPAAGPAPAPGRDARQVAEAFLAAVIKGSDREAVRLSDPVSAIAQQVGDFRQLLNLKEVNVVRVQADDKAALAETTPVTDDRGRTGPLMLTLIRSRGLWVISDIDLETPTSAKKEREAFLQRHPRAVEIPAPAAGRNARQVAEAFLAAAVAGREKEAIGLTGPGSVSSGDIREFAQAEMAKLKIVRVLADDKAALAETTPAFDDQGREGVVALLLIRSPGRWVVQKIAFLRPAASVKHTRTEFLKRYPRAVEIPASAQPTSAKASS